jgi:iron complex outermembrane receptor protein
VNTYSVELQHSFGIGERHDIIWGGGYRLTEDYLTIPPPFSVANNRDRLQLGSLFVQDEFTLTSTLKLTVGLKLEHHTYTGLEYMPNARVAWQPSENNLLWASVSRAVRTPSRLDRDLQALPIFLPATDFDSETLIAYEAGYRGQFFDRLSLSISGFYNDYDKLRTTSLLPSATLLAKLQNGMEGHTYGVEIWGQYAVNEWWRLSGGFTAMHKDLHLKAGVVDISNFQAAGNDPSYQFSMRSLMTPVDDVEFDVGVRVVDNLTAPALPSYVELDARIGWHMTDTIELTIAGFNLLDDQHPEAGLATTRREVRRGISGGVRFSF